jgi:hypothetical protein
VIEAFLTDAWWPGPAIACVLLWVDYALTILGARRYRARIAPMHRFEGSYELTPIYQSDVDQLRVYSWRAFGVGLLLALLLRFIAVAEETLQTYPAIYLFALGAVILREVPVFIRHFKNLFLARVIATEPRIEGTVFYPRTFTLRLSAFDFAEFAAVFLLWAAVAEDWMPLGGAFGCLGITVQQWKLARKHRAAVAAAGASLFGGGFGTNRT